MYNLNIKHDSGSGGGTPPAWEDDTCEDRVRDGPASGKRGYTGRATVVGLGPIELRSYQGENFLMDAFGHAVF